MPADEASIRDDAAQIKKVIAALASNREPSAAEAELALRAGIRMLTGALVDLNRIASALEEGNALMKLANGLGPLK